MSPGRSARAHHVAHPCWLLTQGGSLKQAIALSRLMDLLLRQEYFNEVSVKYVTILLKEQPFLSLKFLFKNRRDTMNG